MPTDRLHVRVTGREAVLAPGLGEVGVGSGEDCLVRVHGDGVAARHAVLVPDAGAWTIAPADPAHALWCDGEAATALRVDRPLTIRLGDQHGGPVFELAPAREDAVRTETGRSDGITPSGAATPSGPRGHTLAGEVTRIGRDPGSDIVLDDVLASRRHAEVRRRVGGAYEVVDAGSQNGTFLNGRRIEREILADRDVITIGHHALRLVGGRLVEEGATGAVAYAAEGLTVRLPDGTVLLDDVSFALERCSMLGVIGPSGSGKSTLLGALTGLRPASAGSVRYEGRDLYAEYDALRRRVGFVPQDDIVHRELTVRRALEYAAEIRFPADTGVDERHARVDGVLDELGLGARADVRVGTLSGGQRKRVSVGLELLTEPALLVLDEPTSGLDPHFERGVMELLRGIADGGRTVVVVTHSMQSLRLCDRLLVMAPGGRAAYFGPPHLAAAYFGVDDLAGVFEALTSDDEADWGARFRAHPLARGSAAEDAPAADRPAPVRSAPRLALRTWWRQLRTLTRRYAEVTLADRRNLALLLLQAPLLGLLMLVALPSDELGPSPPGEIRLISQAALVLLVLTLGVTWLGMSNAAREIAKELPLYARERAAGLSVSAYLASKVAVLGTLTVVQAACLVLLATARQDGPDGSAWLGWPAGELVLAGALGGVAAMAVGLLISALARTPDRAMTVLPIVLVFQLVLALGAVFPQIGDKPVLEQLGWGATSQWTFAASASTTDLNDLQAVTGVLTRSPTVDVDDPAPLFDRLARGERGDVRWDREAGAWWGDAGALVALTALALLAAGLALRRARPA